MKLYDVAHPYRCEPSNYFKRWDSTTETYYRFENWEEFYEEAKGWDDDLNYLFRWDWEPEYKADPQYEDEQDLPEHLLLFFFRQRKGFHVTMHINVGKEDEPKIKEYLVEKSKNLKATWYPILGEFKESLKEAT